MVPISSESAIPSAIVECKDEPMDIVNVQDDSDTDSEMRAALAARPFIRRHNDALFIDLDDDSEEEDEDLPSEMTRIRETISRMEHQAQVRRTHAFHIPTSPTSSEDELPSVSFVHHEPLSVTELLEMATAETRKIDYLKGRLVMLDREQSDRRVINNFATQFNGSTAERIIFVGNIGSGRTHAQIRATFSACGAIARVEVRNKYAYVEFARRESVALAVEMSKTFHFGNKITVRPLRSQTEKSIPPPPPPCGTPPSFQFTFSFP